MTATTNSGGSVNAAAYSAKDAPRDGTFQPSGVPAPPPAQPPYPAPGWGDGPPPEGCRWEWHVADDRWQLGGNGKRCRYTVGPSRLACGRYAVATILRPYHGTLGRRWGYCPDHLYGRHIHDGAIWESRAVPIDGGAS